MRMIRFFIWLFLTGLLCLPACRQEEEKASYKEPATKEELGELLFFDTLLSGNNSISCASCHLPDHAFADTVPFSIGANGKAGRRNTPSAMNLSSRSSFFHDGRAESLEQQAAGPMEDPMEMDIPISKILRKLNENKYYSRFFKTIYKEPATRENLLDALASFERTLETGNTPFDRYMTNDDTTAMSASARRGQIIFNEKGKCFDCHFGPDFTGDEFRNIGLYNGKDLNDAGRFEVTKDSADLGKFKVPGLRNVTVTAPYMHNGMFRSLRDVIDFYDEPSRFVKGSINTDTLLEKPLGLTEQEKLDLLEFLKALTDDRFSKVSGN